MKKIYKKPVSRVVDSDEPLMTILSGEITGGNEGGAGAGEDESNTGQGPGGTGDEENPETAKGNGFGWEDLSGW